jgi:hypothetical protein
MPLDPLDPAAAECRADARRRYRNRPLVWSPEQVLEGAAEGFSVFAAQPLEPGRGLLIQQPEAETLLARVARVDPAPNGAWLLRCRIAG